VPKAIWNDTVIAEASQTEIVEGNHYFPPESLSRQHFRESETTSICPWKGMARYYTIIVGDRENADAAWYYPEPEGGRRQRHRKGGFLEGRQGRGLTSSPARWLDRSLSLVAITIA
jgi:uncharacterized protein (DUF427 family)